MVVPPTQEARRPTCRRKVLPPWSSPSPRRSSSQVSSPLLRRPWTTAHVLQIHGHRKDQQRFPSNGSPSLETEGHLIAKVKGINNPSPNFKSIFLQNFSKFTLQLTHRKLEREERLVLLREGEETGLWSGICWEQCC